MYTHQNNYTAAGTPAAQAKAALVMLHGRGGSAADIIRLANVFNLKDTAIYAPEATNNSWYPYSFMAPEQQNQPALDSALEQIGALVEKIEQEGIASEHIYFAGFSQGACLTLEYVARNAKRYGGAIAYTGGLIGERLVTDRYKGDFSGTPILITTGDHDAHVPLKRVEESVEVLEGLGANVTLKVYPDKPHSIWQEEIELAGSVVFNA
ncbi:alpha/beta hydrolase [Mucilaginibacter auburnensis]|uniref:Phospholipase/carboxylesterase n=1 Tax=Mucilaginibacter auburnensis TaxID=1457233 RepID=A0A2H9VN85_9SPHI|nr:dienelactone hydrolase family protein [Mucilaginibacter auburnensis]PJJ79782.1 phospholipase/carboxylesterase [Mucilaginibacter auburnensis]